MPAVSGAAQVRRLAAVIIVARAVPSRPARWRVSALGGRRVQSQHERCWLTFSETAKGGADAPAPHHRGTLIFNRNVCLTSSHP